MYVEAAKPQEVSRIAVRYINRLLLPGYDLSVYLKAGPALAEGWPTDIRAFLSRVVLLEPERDIVANVVQALEPQTAPGQSTTPVIFDIDVFQEVPLVPDDMTIPGRFARLREMKNRIFFKGITTEGIELFR